MQTYEGGYLSAPIDAARYAMLRLADRKAEVFGGMFLTVRHQLIQYREMFYGTIDHHYAEPTPAEFAEVIRLR